MTKELSDLSLEVAGPVMGSFFVRSRSQEFLTKMEQTKYSRKLDGSGRIMIPIRLREEMGLVSGTEYTFFTHEINGRKFICIECPSITRTELERAIQIVRENGMEIVQNDN